jgi:Glycosyl hydrolases family 16
MKQNSDSISDPISKEMHWPYRVSYHVISCFRFFVDRVPIRVYKNNGKPNNFFPNQKPMYMLSSIWNADDWATRGGLEKTNWTYAPFVSSYKDFNADGYVQFMINEN